MVKDADRGNNGKGDVSEDEPLQNKEVGKGCVSAEGTKSNAHISSNSPHKNADETIEVKKSTEMSIECTLIFPSKSKA